MEDKIIDPQEGIKASEAYQRHLRRRVAPYTRKQPFIQRNDLCPCGSKLKYKRCCGLKNRISMQKKVIEIRNKQRKNK